MPNNIDLFLLHLLNGSQSMLFDQLILFLTNGLTWIPLYIALFIMVLKNNESMTQIFIIVGCCALGVMLTAGLDNLFIKPLVARPRPTLDPFVKYTIDVACNYREKSFSFFSAHAANTFGITVFFAWMVRNKVFTWLLVTWSLVNCYTRLYLAMHYPSDIIVGLAFGALAGSLSYLAYWGMAKTTGAKQHYVSSQYTPTGYAIADIDVVAFVLVATGIAAIVISLMMH